MLLPNSFQTVHLNSYTFKNGHFGLNREKKNDGPKGAIEKKKSFPTTLDAYVHKTRI
jgi:hypothetical protein